MSRTFATITDLAQHLAGAMDLEQEAVTDAIREHSALFGTFGRIPAAELDALSAAVWASVTGLPYPSGWTTTTEED